MFNHLIIFLFALLQLLLCNSWANRLEIDIFKRDVKVKDDEIWQNESIVLYKTMNKEYYGIMKIGSPAQEFKMYFDTTWVDSWVPSQHCGILEVACLLHKRYDSSLSSSYIEDGTLFKASVNGLEGFYSIDIFHLPHLELKNQMFIEITHMSARSYLSDIADGVIGMAFENSSYTKAVPFFKNLQNQNLVKEPIFTLYMNRDETTNKAGKLILGATDRKHAKGKLTVVNVTDNVFWKFDINLITVSSFNKSHLFCKGGCSAIIDSSSSIINGPANETEQINNLLKARKLKVGPFERYMVDCRQYAKLQDVVFQIGGEPFTLKSKYYVQHMNYYGFEICLSPFASHNNTYWLIGGAFLMQFYSEFNIKEKTIAFAQTIV
ncbi:cathepsin D-like [Prorops nasuta]|uniref:cathepsin D-like n=1 Tax=Prorops nasuta TaxID=863751 RepID=UPI0034CD1402